VEAPSLRVRCELSPIVAGEQGADALAGPAIDQPDREPPIRKIAHGRMGSPRVCDVSPGGGHLRDCDLADCAVREEAVGPQQALVKPRKDVLRWHRRSTGVSLHSFSKRVARRLILRRGASRPHQAASEGMVRRVDIVETLAGNAPERCDDIEGEIPVGIVAGREGQRSVTAVAKVVRPVDLMRHGGDVRDCASRQPIADFVEPPRELGRREVDGVDVRLCASVGAYGGPRDGLNQVDFPSPPERTGGGVPQCQAASGQLGRAKDALRHGIRMLGDEAKRAIEVTGKLPPRRRRVGRACCRERTQVVLQHVCRRSDSRREHSNDQRPALMSHDPVQLVYQDNGRTVQRLTCLRTRDDVAGASRQMERPAQPHERARGGGERRLGEAHEGVVRRVGAERVDHAPARGDDVVESLILGLVALTRSCPPTAPRLRWPRGQHLGHEHRVLLARDRHAP